jgi:hypothetical protein
MRVLVVKAPTTVNDLRTRLGRTGAAQTLDDIARLNPHVDLKAIEPGTVLLVPDAPNTSTDDTTPVQGPPFEELKDQIMGAIDATNSRVRAGYESLAAQAREATTVLKSAAIKRAIEVEPTLKAQLDASSAVFKQDAAHAKAADQTLKAIEKQTAAELGALQKLLG